MHDRLTFIRSQEEPPISREAESALVQLLGSCSTCFFATHCDTAQKNNHLEQQRGAKEIVRQESSGEIDFQQFIAAGATLAKSLDEKGRITMQFLSAAHIRICQGPTAPDRSDGTESSEAMICNNPIAQEVIDAGINFMPQPDITPES